MSKPVTPISLPEPSPEVKAIIREYVAKQEAKYGPN